MAPTNMTKILLQRESGLSSSARKFAKDVKDIHYTQVKNEAIDNFRTMKINAPQGTRGLVSFSRSPETHPMLYKYKELYDEQNLPHQ